MTNIKICGITNLEDAEVAVEVEADLLGFIFYKPSPRYVAPDRARDIVGELRGQGLAWPRFVGVFVNESPAEVAQILEFCGLDAAQLHGDESPAEAARFEGRAYKALRPKSTEEAERLVQAYTQEWMPKAQSVDFPQLLLDAYHPQLYGGTGRVTDWTMAAKIAKRHSIMLAGSLTPENVAEAIQAVQPWGVDVSSGVEAEKGKKDYGKVRAFVEAVRDGKGKRDNAESK